MSLALALVFIGFDLIWSGIHDEGPFEEILRAFKGDTTTVGNPPAGATGDVSGSSGQSGLTGFSTLPGGLPPLMSVAGF